MKVFVSCVSQKHGHIKSNISQVKENTLENTFTQWINLTQPGQKPSRDVYKGTQWELIKELDSLVSTKVVSGGYGIIDLTTPIVPYSITLSSAYVENKHLMVPSFGGNQKEVNKEWFSMFGDYSKLWETDETLIFTVNPDYLNVLGLPEKDNIILLTDYKLGILAKWLKSGVNNVAVNFTLYLVKHYPNLSGKKELDQIYEELVKKYGKTLYQKRQKVDDEFISNFIEEGGSLNLLRNKGYKCSTQRFNKLKKLV
tara:strand:- start:1364 stop:2128 length:765 start_codon:yes stop_codon:yes gene_type:complete